MNQLQVHIQLACSDARDYSRRQAEILSRMTEQYRQQGIGISLHTLRVAGAFVTPDVVMDIKRIIEDIQRSTTQAIDVSYYVHIQSHGHLDANSNTAYVSHIYEMNVVPGSPLNCGMLEATTVGIELEQLIISSKPTIHAQNKSFTITDDTGIRDLLRDIYSYDGHLAGDWIRSIDKLRTHPRLQKTILEDAIARDASLSCLDIKITAGIQDYSIHGLIRLDAGDPPVPFWDDAMQEIRDQAAAEIHSWANQAEKQKPFAGLISMSDPKLGIRAKATHHYMKLRDLDDLDPSLTNTVFHITGSSFDLPLSPYGPYVIGGFFFAVKQLNLQEWMVMGNTPEQTARMMRKLKNDPLIQLISNTHGVKWLPFSVSEL